MEPVLIIGGCVGAVAAVVTFVKRLERKRTAAFRQFAEERRYAFESPGPETLPDVPSFELFARGRSKRFNNLISGTKDGATVRLADYQYVAGSGKSRSLYRQTICLVKSPGLALPRFFLRPQHRVLDALGKMLGGQDINFEDDPEFSRAFVLQSPEELRTITQLFTPAVRAHFASLIGRSFRVEGWGDWVLWAADRRLDPKDLDATLVDAITLRRILAYDARQTG